MMKSGPVSVILVGMGGMGYHYLKALWEEFSHQELQVLAVIDPYPNKSEHLAEVKTRGITVFRTLGEAYGSGLQPELTVIASPLQFHVPQTNEALKNKSHVLCEKPMAATIQDAESMIREQEASGRWVRIGYQWSYTPAVLSLKQDVLKGLFGRPRRLKCLYLWARDEAYYRRNDWAGCIKDPEGRWVLDSPANSAMAHDMHNMFFILGEQMDRSAQPAEVTAEAYRAYAIENFDTVVCRVRTELGPELLFYASHAVEKDLGPLFCFEFEEATVTYEPASDDITAQWRTGKVKRYGSPAAEHPFLKLFEAVAAVRDDRPLFCGPEAVRAQTLCTNGIQESVQKIGVFPSRLVKEQAGRRWVDGLGEALFDCYAQGILPSEAGLAWANSGQGVDLREYVYFPGGTHPREGEAR